MTKQILKLTLLSACLCLHGFAADAFPRLSGETLEGKAIVLPDALKGKHALLIVSFSRSAEEQTKAWGEKLKQRSTPVERYQVLELEDVPRFFRGMAKSGIRKGIPTDRQATFFLFFEGQDALKKVTHFQKDNEAYVLLLDQAGQVVWQEHGAADDAKLDTLARQLPKK